MRRHVSESAISRFMLAASMAGAFAVAGCVGTPTSALERMGNAIDQGEMAIDDPHVIIDTLGPVDLEVDSFGGTIRIEAVPGMTGTVIEPVRRAFLGHLRRDEAEVSLDQIDYRIELREGDLDREVLVITTSTTHPEPHFQGVDFMIRTGELGRVDVVTRRGHAGWTSTRPTATFAWSPTSP
jgi:HAMP domain-containing protein